MKIFLCLVVLAAAVFVWLTSEGLPPVVASHFAAGGAANGYSDKGAYTTLMLALVVGMPALFAASTLLIRAPRLPESWFFAGLAAFGAATVMWVLLLYRRFGRGAP